MVTVMCKVPRHYRHLLSRLEPRLQATARKLLLDHDLAADAVVAAVAQVLGNWAVYDKAQDFETWVFSILRYRVIDTYRRAVVARRCEERYETERAAGVDHVEPLQLLGRAEDVARVRAALALIPAAQRRAIVLCNLQALTLEAAAAAARCPVGTMKSRLHRAHAAFRVAYAGIGPTTWSAQDLESYAPPRGRRRRWKAS